MSSSAVSRPLVVLVGWLGCHSNYLRRYEVLYAGFESMTRIPTPTQVIRSTVIDPSKLRLRSPPTWPHRRGSILENIFSKPSTFDLAWEILADMHTADAPVIFIHVFSNGGGFVLEAIASILAESHAFPGPVRERLETIQRRIGGVVIDSAPGMDLHRLPEALSWMSVNERMKVLCEAGPHWACYWWWKWDTPEVKRFLKERSNGYRRFWTENPLLNHVPLLFLYSSNDQLSSSDVIDQLVKHHPQARATKWKDSTHCGHFVRHSSEYRDAINLFIKQCLPQPLGHFHSKL